MALVHDWKMMQALSKITLNRFLSLFIAVVMLVLVCLPVKVFAEGECSEQKLRNLGVVTMNCIGDAAVSSICSATGTTQVEGSDNAEKVWNFFISKGLKPHQAAGFMGNMQEEAHFEPRLVEYGWPNGQGDTSRAGKPSSLVDDIPPNANSKGQPGYGIIQWTSPGRKNGLKAKVDSDPSKRKAGDLILQMEYMWQELSGPYKSSTLNPVLAAGTVEEATKIITYHYEIPAHKEVRAVARTKLARGFLTKYGSLTPSTPAAAPAAPVPSAVGATTPTTPTTTDPATTPTPAVDPSQSLSCNAAAGGSGNINASPTAGGVAFMAIYYAWPEGGHGLTPKPEYAAGIKQFNPNANLAGADCGAFVGTVMHASKADPNYPLGGTSVQMDYVKKHPEKYDVTTNFTVADLLPGDILIVVAGSKSYGHTYIFVGDQGAGRNKADASVGKRMPNLGSAEAVDSSGRGHYTRARLK